MLPTSAGGPRRSTALAKTKTIFAHHRPLIEPIAVPGRGLCPLRKAGGRYQQGQPGSSTLASKSEENRSGRRERQTEVIHILLVDSDL
jgi:hypothetical protein